jgi:hypothetical protein
VWHENKDFSAYYTYKPRFCSEFGLSVFLLAGSGEDLCRAGPDESDGTGF